MFYGDDLEMRRDDTQQNNPSLHQTIFRSDKCSISVYPQQQNRKQVWDPNPIPHYPLCNHTDGVFIACNNGVWVSYNTPNYFWRGSGSNTLFLPFVVSGDLKLLPIGPGLWNSTFRLATQSLLGCDSEHYLCFWKCFRFAIYVFTALHAIQ